MNVKWTAVLRWTMVKSFEKVTEKCVLVTVNNCNTTSGFMNLFPWQQNNTLTESLETVRNILWKYSNIPKCFPEQSGNFMAVKNSTWKSYYYLVPKNRNRILTLGERCGSVNQIRWVLKTPNPRLYNNRASLSSQSNKTQSKYITQKPLCLWSTWAATAIKPPGTLYDCS